MYLGNKVVRNELARSLLSVSSPRESIQRGPSDRKFCSDVPDMRAKELLKCSQNQERYAYYFEHISKTRK